MKPGQGAVWRRPPVAEFNGDGAGEDLGGAFGGVMRHLPRGAGQGRDGRGGHR